MRWGGEDRAHTLRVKEEKKRSESHRGRLPLRRKLKNRSNRVSERYTKPKGEREQGVAKVEIPKKSVKRKKRRRGAGGRVRNEGSRKNKLGNSLLHREKKGPERKAR